MRVFLVGEHNPYGSDPRFALYPSPRYSAAGRLAAVLGYTPEEYLRTFGQRRNLLTELPWSAPRARDAARRVLGETLQGDRLFLLGTKVAAAFGLRLQTDNLVSSVLPVIRMTSERVEDALQEHEVQCLVLPHPSGRSCAWNDAAMGPRVRSAVADLLGVKSYPGGIAPLPTVAAGAEA